MTSSFLWRLGLRMSVALAAASVACSDDEGGTPIVPSGAGTVDIATWWLSGSEQEAVNAAINLYKSESSNNVNVVAITENGPARLQQFRDLAWDVGQGNASDVRTTMCILDPATGGTTGLPPECLRDGNDDNVGYIVQDLNQVSGLASAIARIPDELIPLLTVDGQLLTFPANIHRENTLHYRTELQTVPETLADLRQICDDYRACADAGGGDADCAAYPYGTAAKRPYPMAMAAAAWITRIAVASFLPPEVIAHTAATPAAKTAITAALDALLYLFDQDCLWMSPIDAAGEEHRWALPAHAVIDGDALMYIHGDWAKGEMVFAGAEPGTDFDVAVAPGSSGTFLFGIDVFGMSTNPPNPAEATEYVAFALSEAAQIAFSEKKGSTPAVDIANPAASITNASLRASYDDLQSARGLGRFLQAPGWITGRGDWINLIFSGTYEVPGTAQALMPLPPTLESHRGRSTACVAALYACAYADPTKTGTECETEVLLDTGTYPDCL